MLRKKVLFWGKNNYNYLPSLQEEKKMKKEVKLFFRNTVEKKLLSMHTTDSIRNLFQSQRQ